MRYFLLFTLVFNVSHLLAQKSITIRTVSDDGAVLSKNWKWHEGDNPNWAKPEFDDHQWAAFDPTESIQTLPVLHKAQIGWFRRPIKVSANLSNRPLYLNVSQMGASEIYLDGKLLHTLGVVSKNPALERTDVQAKFLPITFPDTNQHLLAVRFSITKANFYYLGTGKSIFKLKILDIDKKGERLFTSSLQFTGIICFCIGIFLLFSILHFSFYISNRQQRVSLFLGFTMLLFSISFFSNLMEDNHESLTYQQINELITIVTFYAGIFFINISLYLYLSQLFRSFFYVQVFMLIGSLVCIIGGISLPLFIEVWLIFLLVFVDFIRVSLLAERRRNPNAKVPIYSLLAVAACFIIVIIFFIIIGTVVRDYKTIQNFSEIITIISVGLFLIMCLSIPVGLSFSLVLEYSKTLKELRKNIQAIEMLSAKNLAHEKEKQQILATQNETLERQVNERTEALHTSLAELKATQDQLIQSEKLASLGELTAGIAHEIQNPLNFVNNFSEVSAELVEEMQEELNRDDTEEAKAIADDLKQNLKKITHHGKRASSIVKGMLEHSRTSTGEREWTDINQLADEYLRLSYHGLRAKDSRFNADYALVTDKNLPKIKIVPQDIGRVLLNLINNAFYAVSEEAKRRKGQGDLEYKPFVSLSTQLTADSRIGGPAMLIAIKDNGTGMSEEIKTKMFQPFFTTKPTGQGTGLGLSLAYDIVTKGHGGTIEVESEEAEGTTFTICLPCSNV